MLVEFLTTCIHPLDVNSQNIETILNIYTGETACPEVNVNKSVKFGEKMMLDP